MQEWIHQIVTYVILITVLRGLIRKPNYEQYFRFFSGIILILLVISPVLHYIKQDTQWYDMLQEKLLQIDMDSIREELAVTEGKRQEVIMEQYEAQIEEQIIAFGREENIRIEEVVFQISEEGEIQRMEIHLGTEENAGKLTKEMLRNFRQKLCKRYELQEEQVVLWI